MGLCGEAQNVGRWQKINVESRMQINDCPHKHFQFININREHICKMGCTSVSGVTTHLRNSVFHKKNVIRKWISFQIGTSFSLDRWREFINYIQRLMYSTCLPS